MPLRPYQSDLDSSIVNEWSRGRRHVLAVMPTGGGKTVNMSHRAREHNGASVCIAHRQELVGQISLSLARNGVRHRIIGPSSAIKSTVSLHMMELGRSFYSAQAPVGVAGVDTLIRRPPDDAWFKQITLWQTDEAHHLLVKNKWGKAVALFPDAYGIGWTATPSRADGYGLGAHADGVFESLIQGPEMAWLIENGFLTPYRILAPESGIDWDAVPVTDGGDFSATKLKAAVEGSHITGDVVDHYHRHAWGKRGVTFAVDIDHAKQLVEAYRYETVKGATVPTELITSKTPDAVRVAILRRFRSGDVQQLVNVDLFGEGFDLPAIEVVSMARATASYSLYAQQFGRALRLLEGKKFGLILDHVGNTVRHGGPPDQPRNWSLDRRERRGPHRPADGIPMRTCPKCTAPYARTRTACPYCGYAPEPLGRSLPEQVDGDLVELTPEVRAKLWGEVARVDGPAPSPISAPYPVRSAMVKNHAARQAAQVPLRQMMEVWGGWRHREGDGTREMQRRFYLSFGVDVATAQTLGEKDASGLMARLAFDLASRGVAW